jgi:hypothetical protein
MQMATDRGGKRTWWRSRSWMPLFSVFLGTAVLVAFWVGGSPRQGLYGFAVMGGLGLVFLFGSQSETIRGLGGPAATSAGRTSTSLRRRSRVSS